MKAEEVRYETPLTEFLFQKAGSRRIPLSGTFELSPVCNFACRMCYVRRTQTQVMRYSRKILGLEQWKRIADEATAQGMLYLLLTGGEPFLWPDFWKLYEYLSGKGLLLTINSNGSLIDEETVRRLREHPPTRINITLYGASDETYKRLCAAEHGFQRTEAAILRLKDAGIQVKLNCSLTPYNVQDLEAMIRWAEKEELIIETNSYMFPPIRRDEDAYGKNDRFTPWEAAYWHIRRYLFLYGEEHYRTYLENIANGLMDPLGLDESCYDPVDGKVRCRAGSAAFWVSWDGYLLPCGMMSRPKVDLQKEAFPGAWEKLVRETGRVRLSGVCAECVNRSICHSCAAMALAETGAFEKVPQYLCEMMEAMKQIAQAEIRRR